MGVQLNDSVIRAQLHVDLQTAWDDLVDIFDDAPLLPAKRSQLPRAFIMLADQLQPQRNTGTAGIAEVSIPHPYTLTRQALWPTGETTIEAVKVAMVQALLDILTAGTRYCGGVRDVVSIKLTEGAFGNEGQKQAFYELSVEFRVEVVTGA